MAALARAGEVRTTPFALDGPLFTKLPLAQLDCGREAAAAVQRGTLSSGDADLALRELHGILVALSALRVCQSPFGVNQIEVLRVRTLILFCVVPSLV